MPNVERTVKIITKQTINPKKPAMQEGYPFRNWSIEIYLLHETDGTLVPANVYEKAVYKLHPSFEKRAVQTFKPAPFRIEEEGWGEFDMQITLPVVHKGGEHEIKHDLNFAVEEYEALHKVVFKNPKEALLALLRESGPVGGEGGEANGVGKKGEGAKKRNRKDKNVDMEKLAEGLQRLGEEDLLQVVQMVHDNKTADTYTKNDVENGEFHVDLYTLPDALVKMLWDFAASKVEL